MITYINVEERQEANGAARALLKIETIQHFKDWNEYFKVILYMCIVRRRNHS